MGNKTKYIKEDLRIIFTAWNYENGDQIPVNIQTENFRLMTGMPELQLTVPLRKDHIINIIQATAQELVEGLKIEENQEYEILPGYPKIKLKNIRIKEKEEYIRIIMPDYQNKFPEESAVVPYSNQLEEEPYLLEERGKTYKMSLIVIKEGKPEEIRFHASMQSRDAENG